MFERFSDHARRVIVLAQEEAVELNHDHIGTEHLLLALIREEDSAAARALAEADIGLVAARRKVTEIVGKGENAATGHIPFTPRSKRVLELSLREALQIGDNFIGAEHLLLGLITEGEGVGARALVEMGAELPALRSRTMSLHATESPDPGPATPRVTRHTETRTRLTRSEARSTAETRLAAIERRLARIEGHLNLPSHDHPEEAEKPEQAEQGGPGEQGGPKDHGQPGGPEDPGAGRSN